MERCNILEFPKVQYRAGSSTRYGSLNGKYPSVTKNQSIDYYVQMLKMHF